MSKRVAFIVLSVLAVGFAILAVRREADFLSDVWSQLFWLTLATLATTFALDAVLQRAAHVSQRSRDAFAFRSFVANMLLALSEIVRLPTKDDQIVEAVLSGDAPFKVAVGRAASLIEQSSEFEPGAYLKHYLNMGSGLRDLSLSYIRLFSTNRREMLALHRELNELAIHWNYKDEFSDGSRKHTASLVATDTGRAVREAALQDQIASARTVAVSTARQLAKLAERAASGKGFYD